MKSLRTTLFAAVTVAALAAGANTASAQTVSENFRGHENHDYRGPNTDNQGQWGYQRHGNDGQWGEIAHPQRALLGHAVGSELAPGIRYDRVVEAFGGYGELVERPDDLRPALERALASGKPACVNVLTDPKIPFPRSTQVAV